MTPEEAKANQDSLVARGMKLGWWYGVRCKKCCGVYPKLMHTADLLKCFYECEVCGRRTAPVLMPWIAEEAWNNDEVEEGQMNIYSFLGGNEL